jgi:hypothetical protein
VLRPLGVTLSPFDVDTVLHDLRVAVDGFGKLDYRKFMDALKSYLIPGEAPCGRMSAQCTLLRRAFMLHCHL